MLMPRLLQRNQELRRLSCDPDAGFVYIESLSRAGKTNTRAGFRTPAPKQAGRIEELLAKSLSEGWMEIAALPEKAPPKEKVGSAKPKTARNIHDNAALRRLLPWLEELVHVKNDQSVTALFGQPKTVVEGPGVRFLRWPKLPGVMARATGTFDARNGAFKELSVYWSFKDRASQQKKAEGLAIALTAALGKPKVEREFSVWKPESAHALRVTAPPPPRARPDEEAPAKPYVLQLRIGT